MESKRYTIILEPISKRVNVSQGQTVYEALLSLNYPIGALCGGKGTCGKCLIRVIDKDAKLSPPSKEETYKLGKEKLSQGFRLACQTKIEGDSRVYLTDSLLSNSNRILIDSDIKSLGIEQKQELDPIIRAEFLQVRDATLENPISDLNRFEDSLEEAKKTSKSKHDYQISSNNNVHSDRNRQLTNKPIVNDQLFQLLTTFPTKIRNDTKNITAFFRKNMQIGSNSNIWELFDVEEGDNRDKIYGLAVDIGTTTIVAYLINLNNGELISIAAMLNPQTAIGEDLISRITFIKKNNAILKAQELLTSAINNLLIESCAKGSVKVSDVRDIVVVGNTGIHHMFFGLPSEFLALSPFTPVVKAPIYIRAKSLGLTCNPNANLYSPPVIAGFVGTDTIGCILTSRIDLYDKYTLLIDIGTNGELVLGNKYSLVTGSCAAGSALEGAQISNGMRAAEGSIECVSIDEKTLNPTLKTIGNIEPVGICGSGLIDIVAEMLRRKIINRSGKFNTKSDSIKSNKRIIQTDGEYKYIVYNRDWDFEINGFQQAEQINENPRLSKKMKDVKPEFITISQEDIRQIQLAKGAFLSGANILLNYENKDHLALEQVMLAGAFGTYINKENARFIGLFPEINHQKIFQIGNAAGMGAQICLKSAQMRYLADDLAYRVKYHEIASSPIFQHEYAYALYFPYFDLNKFPDLKEAYKDIPTK